MIHRRRADARPLGVATSAMVVTTVATAVPASVALPRSTPSIAAVAALQVLGLLCTGATLVLFYTLIAQKRTWQGGPGLLSIARFRSRIRGGFPP